MKNLPDELSKQLIESLPVIRKKLIAELSNWEDYSTGVNFHSDEEFFKLLPSSAYEYLFVCKKISLDKESAAYWLNNMPFDYIQYIAMHTLRRLALLDGYSQK
ncbi:MAG TPA: hypothetical protein VN922_22890 [Bacteroidia bacterium]|nr:hypothetical protein [Bacteroidia bacterium]